MQKKHILIIGGGSAGLFVADAFSEFHKVTLYEKEQNPGNKFLVAARGGLNITNSLQGANLLCRYTPAGFMDEALLAFDTMTFRQWLSGLNIPTFVGTSGRVFPAQDIRSKDILRRIKERLISRGCEIYTQHEFVYFNTPRQITLKHNNGMKTVEGDHIVFALGGASWPQTGSNGSWTTAFNSLGIATKPFQPSNCGINIAWPASVTLPHAGKPLKNIALTFAGVTVKGEALVTTYGLEGNAVYPLVPHIRNMLGNAENKILNIDFKPGNSVSLLLKKFADNGKNTKDYAATFNLRSVQMAIIKAFTQKEEFLNPERFVHSIKQLPITIASLRPLEESISTIGGICTNELDTGFSLKKYPWITVIGEMVDWDAPTGGFLLQGCFSMARFAARAVCDEWASPIS
jgi:uncharacterized flavoprotein (TIGR03862 family)